PPGSRIAILADNHPRWVAAYLGIIAAGGTAVPLDTGYHAEQVAKLLRDSGSVLLVSDARHLEIAHEAISGTEIQLVLTHACSGSADRGRKPISPRAGDLDSIFAAPRSDFRPVSRELNALASLLYPPGPTADPKGVMLTHANLLAEAEAVFAWAHIGPDD